MYHYDNNNGTSPSNNQSYGGPLGLSALRVSRAPPNNGLWNSEQYHYTVLLKRICKLIEWKVGRTITAPTSSKQPKMGEPSKYSGNRNHDVFPQWLNQFLNWLRSHYHCGEDTDFSRVNFLGSYLDGVAANWFAADVDNPNKVMDPLLLWMQYVLCMDGLSEQQRLTTLPPNMTRWNMALRLESKDSIMPWTKWLVAWLNDLVTTHSAYLDI